MVPVSSQMHTSTLQTVTSARGAPARPGKKKRPRRGLRTTPRPLESRVMQDTIAQLLQRLVVPKCCLRWRDLYLRNIDEMLAKTVADKLGLQKLPRAADVAVPCRPDLDRSPALSIVQNGPHRFEGPSSAFLTEGTDTGLVKTIATRDALRLRDRRM